MSDLKRSANVSSGAISAAKQVSLQSVVRLCSRAALRHVKLSTMEPTERQQEASIEDEADALEVLCDASEFPESEEKLIPIEASDQSVVSDPRPSRRSAVPRPAGIYRALWHSPPPVRSIQGSTHQPSSASSGGSTRYLTEDPWISDCAISSRERNRSNPLKRLERVPQSSQLQGGISRKRSLSLHTTRIRDPRRSPSSDASVRRSYEAYSPQSSVHQFRGSISPDVAGHPIRRRETPEPCSDRQSSNSSFEEIGSLSPLDDLFSRLKNVMQCIDPEEPFDSYLGPWRAAGGNVCAIADIAASRLIQYGATLLFSEDFLNNVHYVLRIAEDEELRSGAGGEWRYSNIVLLKRNIWHHLRETLPDLLVQKLIYAIAWRRVFGDYYMLSLLKAAFLPNFRRLREQLIAEGPTGVKEAERLTFIVIGSLPDSFVDAVAVELLSRSEINNAGGIGYTIGCPSQSLVPCHAVTCTTNLTDVP